MNFITDEEKDLSQNDLLQTNHYANSLKTMIMNAPTLFNIGLYGEWGSGKSSIIKTVQNELEKEETQKIKFVVYDAWKYANDSFRRMFLKTLQQQLRFDGTEFFNSFYQNETKDEKITQKFNWHYLGLILFFGCLAILATFTFSKEGSNTTTIIQSIIMILVALIAFFKNAFTDYKVTISKPMIFAPEQFEDAFNDMMSKTLKKHNKIEQVIEYFKKNTCETNIDKLVIVVDNIDRCDKKTAYELLTNIKNFVGTKEGIIFLIPVDDEALKRHIQEHNKENAKEADEFLRKFFNVTLKIKHFQSRDLFIFADNLNFKHQLGFQPDTINIIAKEYASNPRRIIQLFNNLSSELQTIQNKHEKEFTNTHQSLIAKLLIIREEWSEVFKIITAFPHLLNNLSTLEEEIQRSYSKEYSLSSSFQLFMERTRAIKASPLEIEKIVLNITNHSTLSQEILSILDKNDHEKIKKLVQDDTSYKKIVEYAITELKQGLERKTYSTGARNALMLLVTLNQCKELDKAHNNEINGLFYKLDHVVPTITHLQPDEWDDFYKLVDTNAKQGSKELQNLILNEYTKCWKDSQHGSHEEYSEIFQDGLKCFINNCSDTAILKKLQTVFLSYYNHYSDSPLYKTQLLNEDKLSFIISQNMSESLIAKIKSNIDITSNEYLDLEYFGKQNLLSLKMLDSLFTNIKPDLTQRFSGPNQPQFKVDLIQNLFSNIQAIIRLLQVTSITQYKSLSLIAFLQEILATRTIQFVQNGSLRNFNLNLLDDISGQDENKIHLLNFYLEIYRTSSGNTNIISYATALINKFQTIKIEFYNGLITLRNTHGFNLAPWFDYLVLQTDIDKKLFDLYEKLFSNSSQIDKKQEIIKTKLSNYIDSLLSNYDEVIETFIKTMMSYSTTKTMIAESIMVKQPSDIIKLPQSIKQLAYDDLCENDKIFDIENEIEAIKDILSCSDKYNDCIVKIIIRKLQNNNEVGDAIEILSALNNPSDENKADIKRELTKLKKHEEYGEIIKDLIKKFTPKKS